jgi:hypothetical protein
VNDILFYLQKEKVLTESSIASVENYMKKWDEGAFYSVLDCNLITQSEIADILSRELKIDRIYHLTAKMVEPKALVKIPFSKSVKYDAIPIRLINDDEAMLEVVVANPTDEKMLYEIEKITGMKVSPVVTELRSIRSLVHEIYPLKEQVPSLK